MPGGAPHSDTVRTFLALYPDPAAVEGMGRILEDLRRSGALVRWEKTAQLHITLRFLGELSRTTALRIVDDLRGRLHALAPFSGAIDRLDAFPNVRRPRIVWLGFTHPPPPFEPLSAAVTAACTAAGIPPEDKPFTPHFTVGRVREQARPGDLEKVLAACTFHDVPAQFGALRMMASRLTPQGAIHTELARIDFTPGEHRGETTIIHEE